MKKRIKKKLGSVVQNARDACHLTRGQLARKLKISEVYVGHIENENPAAPVSERVIFGLCKSLGIPLKKIAPLAEIHNARVSSYQRERRRAA